MRYRVRWERQALERLAHLWTEGDSALRRKITVATRQVDRRLRRNPRNEGESRSGVRRIMFVKPLAVIFRIEDDDNTVSVLELRVYRTGGK